MKQLLLAQPAAEAMLVHAEFCQPEECCGLLAGTLGVESEVIFVYPLTNAQHSPTAYTIDPKEHFHAWRHAESRGWELIGAFHSHPGGPPLPSATDLALAAEPDWAYLIVHDRSIRGFMIHGRKAEEIELRYLPANTGRQAGS